jgi:hypothetical protein
MKIEFKMGMVDDQYEFIAQYDEVFTLEDDTFPAEKIDMLFDLDEEQIDNLWDNEEAEEVVTELSEIIAYNQDVTKEMYQKLYPYITRSIERYNVKYFEVAIWELLINGKPLFEGRLPIIGEEPLRFIYGCWEYEPFDPNGKACCSY